MRPRKGVALVPCALRSMRRRAVLAGACRRRRQRRRWVCRSMATHSGFAQWLVDCTSGWGSVGLSSESGSGGWLSKQAGCGQANQTAHACKAGRAPRRRQRRTEATQGRHGSSDGLEPKARPDCSGGRMRRRWVAAAAAACLPPARPLRPCSALPLLLKRSAGCSQGAGADPGSRVQARGSEPRRGGRVGRTANLRQMQRLLTYMRSGREAPGSRRRRVQTTPAQPEGRTARLAQWEWL